ncbi:hypothetical protein ACFL2H_09010 [Planctomycetota bacterium]
MKLHDPEAQTMGYTPIRDVTRVLCEDDFEERHLADGRATIKKLSSHHDSNAGSVLLPSTEES